LSPHLGAAVEVRYLLVFESETTAKRWLFSAGVSYRF